MKTLSIVLLTVWIMITGAISAAWITMLPHTYGVLTFIIGLVILLVELWFYGTSQGWFKGRA
jgi:hypothetical protein